MIFYFVLSIEDKLTYYLSHKIIQESNSGKARIL